MARNVRNNRESLGTRFGHDIALVVVGVLVGAVGAVLYQGGTSGDPDRVGAGLSELIGSSTEDAPKAGATSATTGAAAPEKTSFDFYTVLPEIEHVIPEPQAETDSTAVASATVASAAQTAAAPEKKTPSSYYMLQAGSYNNPGDAERLKARLAMAGFEPSIQHISVQGRGDFYRVRVGPYQTMETMESANRALNGLNIKALRLKVSSKP